VDAGALGGYRAKIWGIESYPTLLLFTGISPESPAEFAGKLEVSEVVDFVRNALEKNFPTKFASKEELLTAAGSRFFQGPSLLAFTSSSSQDSEEEDAVEQMEIAISEAAWDEEDRFVNWGYPVRFFTTSSRSVVNTACNGTENGGSCVLVAVGGDGSIPKCTTCDRDVIWQNYHDSKAWKDALAWTMPRVVPWKPISSPKIMEYLDNHAWTFFAVSFVPSKDCERAETKISSLLAARPERDVAVAFLVCNERTEAEVFRKALALKKSKPSFAVIAFNGNAAIGWAHRVPTMMEREDESLVQFLDMAVAMADEPTELSDAWEDMLSGTGAAANAIVVDLYADDPYGGVDMMDYVDHYYSEY